MLDVLIDYVIYIGLFFLASIFVYFVAEKTVEWIGSKEFWCITVDGETFNVVCNLDVIQKYHEARFWDCEKGCWRHLIYTRLELYRLRQVEEDEQ